MKIGTNNVLLKLPTDEPPFELFDACAIRGSQTTEPNLYINGIGVAPFESEVINVSPSKTVYSALSRWYYRVEYLEDEGDSSLDYSPYDLRRYNRITQDYLQIEPPQFQLGDLIVGNDQTPAEIDYAAMIITEIAWEMEWLYFGHFYRADGVVLEHQMGFSEADCLPVTRRSIPERVVQNPYFDADELPGADFTIQAIYCFLKSGENYKAKKERRVQVRRRTDKTQDTPSLNGNQPLELHHQGS